MGIDWSIKFSFEGIPMMSHSVSDCSASFTNILFVTYGALK